jgi:hypothetical protein
MQMIAPLVGFRQPNQQISKSTNLPNLSYGQLAGGNFYTTGNQGVANPVQVSGLTAVTAIGKQLWSRHPTHKAAVIFVYSANNPRSLIGNESQNS